MHVGDSRLRLRHVTARTRQAELAEIGLEASKPWAARRARRCARTLETIRADRPRERRTPPAPRARRPAASRRAPPRATPHPPRCDSRAIPEASGSARPSTRDRRRARADGSQSPLVRALGWHARPATARAPPPRRAPTGAAGSHSRPPSANPRPAPAPHTSRSSRPRRPISPRQLSKASGPDRSPRLSSLKARRIDIREGRDQRMVPETLERLGPHRAVIGEPVCIFEIDPVEALEGFVVVAHFPALRLWLGAIASTRRARSRPDSSGHAPRSGPSTRRIPDLAETGLATPGLWRAAKVRAREPAYAHAEKDLPHGRPR